MLLFLNYHILMRFMMFYQEFIDLENTPFNNQSFMPAIYVRDCYPKLLQKILKMFKDEKFDRNNLKAVVTPILGIILTGSSG